jgi:hypothetical protein
VLEALALGTSAPKAPFMSDDSTMVLNKPNNQKPEKKTLSTAWKRCVYGRTAMDCGMAVVARTYSFERGAGRRALLIAVTKETEIHLMQDLTAIIPCDDNVDWQVAEAWSDEEDLFCVFALSPCVEGRIELCQFAEFTDGK